MNMSPSANYSYTAAMFNAFILPNAEISLFIFVYMLFTIIVGFLQISFIFFYLFVSKILKKITFKISSNNNLLLL